MAFCDRPLISNTLPFSYRQSDRSPAIASASVQKLEMLVIPQCCSVVSQVIADKGGDEIVAVVVAGLHP